MFDNTADVGSGYSGSSIMVDDSNKAHIAYHHYRNAALVDLNDLYTATNTSGSWLSNLADGDSVAYSAPGFYRDADGSLHLAHNTTTSTIEIYDYSAVSLVAASGPSGAISPGGPYHVRAAADPSGNAHVMFAQLNPSAGAHYITYSTNASGSWETQDLNVGATPDPYISFAIRGMRAQNNRP